jgi:hypothetical protein
MSLKNAATFPGGPAFDLFCQSVAMAITSWLPGGVNLVGVTTGVVGAGIINGTLAFAGNVQLVRAAMFAFQGTEAPQLAAVIANGLTTGLMGTTYTGVSTGVALGTDVSKVVSANSTTLAQALRSAHVGLCAAQGGTGATISGFYESLANGIVTVVSTGMTIPPTGVVAPSGPVGPTSSVGTSVSVPV